MKVIPLWPGQYVQPLLTPEVCPLCEELRSDVQELRDKDHELLRTRCSACVRKVGWQ